jgi:hypothetical protein
VSVSYSVAPKQSHEAINTGLRQWLPERYVDPGAGGRESVQEAKQNNDNYGEVVRQSDISQSKIIELKGAF